MTDKELHRLKRSELLEILVEMSEENDRLKEENESLKNQLCDKNIQIENSGSIAEAALKLSGIFEAAQKAADCYLENIKNKK